MATNITDRDTKPDNLIDHQGVDTGSPKPLAPLAWEPPGYRRPTMRVGRNLKPRRPR